jgi:poly(A) polymerase
MKKLLADPNVQKLFRIFDLERYQIRLVGGCVRDALLNRPIGDKDLATNAQPQQVINLLTKYAIRAVPTGIAYGTVTAVMDGKHYEITTLRRDVSTDGRRAVVAFSDSWQEDAARRDFTINAISLDSKGNIFDYFDGQADLKKKTLRFIGKAEQRMEEDLLRVLRYFRFAAQLDWKLNDKKTLALCKKMARKMEILSRERIQSELYKILSAKGAARVIKQLSDLKILGRKLNVARLKKVISIEKEPDAFRRLIALCDKWNVAWLHDIAVLSNIQKKRLDAVCALAAAKKIPLTHQLYYYGAETVTDFVILSGKKENLAKIKKWKKPSFPLRAQDIMELAGGAGPELGRILKEAEAYWVKNNFRPTRKALIARVKTSP